MTCEEYEVCISCRIKVSPRCKNALNQKATMQTASPYDNRNKSYEVKLIKLVSGVSSLLLFLLLVTTLRTQRACSQLTWSPPPGIFQGSLRNPELRPQGASSCIQSRAESIVPGCKQAPAPGLKLCRAVLRAASLCEPQTRPIAVSICIKKICSSWAVWGFKKALCALLL